MLRRSIEGGLYRLRDSFERAPLFSVWGTLQGLARNYGGDISVYRHISGSLGVDLSEMYQRDVFKRAYLRALRKIGFFPTDTAMPTGLFFSALGIADLQIERLADIFLLGAKRIGPPALEDPHALKAWQNRVTRWELQGLTRVQEALRADRSGYYASLFSRWRAGERTEGPGQQHFLSTLDERAEVFGLSRDKLPIEPVLHWTSNGLALIAKPSAYPQTLRQGSLPRPITPGRITRIMSPLPEWVTWSCAGVERDIAIAPTGREILVFNDDTGALIHRGDLNDGDLLLPSSRLFFLSSLPIEVSGPGGGLRHEEGTLAMAGGDLGMGDVILRADGVTMRLSSSQDSGMQISGNVIARAGGSPLHGSNAVLRISSTATGDEEERFLQISGSGSRQIRHVALSAEGRTQIPLRDLSLPLGEDPHRLTFSLLARGAERLENPRTEHVTHAYYWAACDEHTLEGGFHVDVCPTNLVREMCNGLEISQSLIHLPEYSTSEKPTIAFEMASNGVSEDQILEKISFSLPNSATRCFHIPLSGDPKFVPFGADLRLGEQSRNDAVRILSSRRDADLSFCGEVIRKPFFARESWEFPVANLRENAPKDDTVRLLRPGSDGVDSSRVLFRVIGTDDSDAPELVSLDPTRILLPYPDKCREITLQRFSADGEERMSVSLDHRPGTHAAWDWMETFHDREKQKVSLSWRNERAPRDPWALAFSTFSEPFRDEYGLAYLYYHRAHTVLNANTARFAIQVAMTRVSDSSAQVNMDGLSNDLVAAKSFISSGGLLTPLVRALRTTPLSSINPPDSYPLPAFNLLGWHEALFEADPSVLMQLKTVLPGAGSLSEAIQAVEGAEDSPRLRDWISSVLPGSPQEEHLRHALSAGRARVSRDPHGSLTLSREGRILRDILDTFAEDLARLMRFDPHAGGDQDMARLAQFMDRFARACVAKGTGKFLDDLALRTGWPRNDVVRSVSLAIFVAQELLFLLLARQWAYKEMNS